MHSTPFSLTFWFKLAMAGSGGKNTRCLTGGRQQIRRQSKVVCWLLSHKTKPVHVWTPGRPRQQLPLWNSGGWEVSRKHLAGQFWLMGCWFPTLDLNNGEYIVCCTEEKGRPLKVTTLQVAPKGYCKENKLTGLDTIPQEQAWAKIPSWPEIQQRVHLYKYYFLRT